MRKNFSFLLILVCLLNQQVFAQQKRLTRSASPKNIQNKLPLENGTKLPIRRVILYSNGVAYIERRGVVTGNVEINLSFKQSQVDDVLKSMVVLDLNKGKIGAVSYNSSAPVSARMAEIPFSVGPVSAEGGGIAGVLAQLQGARVAVVSDKGAATGSILTVERKQIRSEKETTTTSVLVIASETGEISSFDLKDVRSVKLLDEGARKDINEFANATASTRRVDAKTITVTSEGAGEREMIVSYTIAAPIWKTTYRVVLDKEGKPFFQGWAIVDNVSEEDWENVQLSLVSGSPVSFIQQLQKPFYRYRPVVPTPQDLQLQPQVYEPQSGVVTQTETVNTTSNSLGNVVTQRQVQQLPLNGRNYSALQLQPGVTSNQTQNAMVVDGQENSNFSTSDVNSTTISDALRNSAGSYQTTTVGEEIGDLFEYRIEQPVTVMRDRSALIPIVQTNMDGERVAIYNEAVRRDRPYSGVLLKNLTNLTLESGSLTVIDSNAYAGEALMERLKPKEQRLISFALDLGMNLRVRQVQNREAAKLVKIINGVFQVHYYTTDEKLYQITNQTDRPKVLYIEYPVRDGWELSEKTPKPAYTTQRYHRFRVELKPFEEKEITVAERQPLMDNYALTSLTRPQLELFLSKRYIDEATKAKLEKLIDLRMQTTQIEQKLEGLDDEEESISADQKRLRENIEALSKTAEAKTLIARYIQKADAQESRLEQIEKERKSLQQQREQLEAQLANEIRGFQLERNAVE